MEDKITFGKIIAFLKIYLTVACCWPLRRDATKFQKLQRNVLQCFCVANAVILSIALTWTLINNIDNALLVMKVGCQLSAILQIVLQLSLVAMENKRFQFVVLEMEDFYQQAQEYERDIIQHYVNKCKVMYSFILYLLATTAISMGLGPVFLPQPFPCDAEYPFDVQHQPLKAIIYAHHLLAIYQSMTQVAANTLPALLLWFVAIRFDILSNRFRSITNIQELIKCTHEHYVLLNYAKEVNRAIAYLALLCVTFSTGAVIFGYLTFMSRQPLSVKCSFILIAFSAFVELYMYAWPADNVMNKSSDIASAAYDSLWYDKDVTTQKILIQVILRSQRPVNISIPGFLPSLSMNYYSSYVSTVFSYMAFIRIIMGEE